MLYDVVHCRGAVEIKVAGYGDHDSEDGHGTIVRVEERNGSVRVIVWSDINNPDPTIIDMWAAMESNRKT